MGQKAKPNQVSASFAHAIGAQNGMQINKNSVICSSKISKFATYLLKKAALQGTSRIKIRRMSEKIEVTIHTARPGMVIGKKGAEIEILKGELLRTDRKRSLGRSRRN